MEFLDDFGEKELARIQQALSEKAPHFKACPLCGTDNWTPVPGVLRLSIQRGRKPDTLVLGGPTVPELALVCVRCGNTILMNVYVLGIADLFGLTSQPEQATPEEVKTPVTEKAT